MKKTLRLLSLAALTIGLLGSCSKMNERIDGLDQRVGNIENEKIASIENQIAAINSSIADLGAIRKDITDLQVAVGDKAEEISKLKEADEALGQRIDELKAYVGDLSKYAEKDWVTAAFATVEKLNETNTALSALEEKVNKLGETTDAKIAGLKTELTNAIDSAISGINESISALEARVSALEQMIQTVSIVPAYDDGSLKAMDGSLYLDIIVTPAEAVAALGKDSLKVLVNEVAKTKAVSVDTVAVTNFKKDATKGTITARADISSVMPASGNALTVAVNVKNGISDYITDFYPVTLSSGVTVKEESTAIKVTIKADEDFPGPVIGNIVVAEGFKESKTTTIDVQGIGTVTFDETATNKIKNNATQAGATSVLFKVEDVTTTKPVENADVVLEVTMKTFDENGKEVFNEKNAEGEVTIQIPLEEAYYVNSVTLVNDAGEPIPGGVVPGSEEVKDGILTFKVNHFSKYAVDYVTREEFVSVTGVSLDSTSVSLPVGDSTKLIATITPENATNKKVTWSSSDPTKVTVDEAGNVKAVAFGKATITVTTKDGGKKATCEVSVKETKTMAEILGTNTGIPESQNLTPPANAWVKKTDKECKAFVGYDGEDKVFVVYKRVKQDQETDKIVRLEMLMDDDFEKIDDNTYRRVEESVGTFTVKMTEGKFTSYEFTAASGSGDEALNGTYAAPEVILPAGALKGGFSVSTTKTVYFSKGNLVATINASGAPTAWKFATNQYDYLGEGGANKTIGNTGGDVDLFGWSTSSDNYGIKTSTTDSDYSGDVKDWGTAIDGNGTWRTLSTTEWQYLFNRDNIYGTNNRSGKYKHKVKVCGKANCVVLLPDNWQWDASTVGTDWQKDANAEIEYSEKTTIKWSTMEAAGAVCLPAAGYRTGSDVKNADNGYYWSITAYTSGKTYCVNFNSSNVYPASAGNHSMGCSVRLITESN